MTCRIRTLSSGFGSFMLSRFISGSHTLALPSSLAPHPHTTSGICILPSRERHTLSGVHCQIASHETVAGNALTLGYCGLHRRSSTRHLPSDKPDNHNDTLQGVLFQLPTRG